MLSIRILLDSGVWTVDSGVFFCLFPCWLACPVRRSPIRPFARSLFFLLSACKHGGALTAERSTLGVLKATLRAAETERRSASTTKFRPLWVFEPTATTIH